jgi:CubicO group peptidase (beta-lactamase class C family)
MRILFKILKVIGLFLGSIILAFFLFAAFTGKFFVFKALYYNFAGIDDYKIFDNRVIKKSTQPQPWPVAVNYNKVALPKETQEALVKYESIAFLVIKNDSIVHEQYWDGYGPSSLSNSFSMAKSVVSILIGAAIKDGKIKSIDQPIGDFLPEFTSGGKEKITIHHLLMMSSGLNWQESYANPVSMTTEAYYGDDLRSLLGRMKAIETPGKYFNYLSGDTQILSFVLKAATGKSLSEYAAEKLWQPLGAENDALWSLDKKEGDEKAYCCINSNARDFARIGKLYLQDGYWNGQQIVDTSWVKASTTPDLILDNVTKQPIDYYGLQWWLIKDSKGQDDFYMRGIGGQYVIVIPSKKIIIVRLGRKRSKERIGEHLKDTYEYLDGMNQVF